MKTNGRVADPTTDETVNEKSYFKERLLRDAERLDEKDINELEESVPKKLKSMELGHLGDGVQWLGSMLERVKGIYSMLFDKEYQVSTRTKLLAGAALLYFVLPTDVVPDFIPGIGFLDDALVLGSLWKLVGVEISAYMAAKTEGRGEAAAAGSATDTQAGAEEA